MSLPEDLDRHSIYIARVATELLRTRIFPSYDEAYKAVRLILLDAENIGSPTKLSLVNKAIAKAIEASTNPAWEETSTQLTELAVYESSYYAELIGGYAGRRMKTPPQRQVKDWMERALMVLESNQRKRAGTWPEFVRANQGSFISSVQDLVKSGVRNGETVNDMTRNLRPLVDGLLKREAESLVRTAVQFYANEGRQQMIAANKDLISREIPYVTFDNRTSATCRSIDSLYSEGWPVGESPIGYPPYHFGCRTTIVPLVEGQEMPDGLRPAVGAKDTEEAKDKFIAKEERIGKKPKYKSRRDLDIFEIDRIKTDTRYDAWLRRQPRFFIEDVLGETRAKLFIDGKYSLASFSDMTLRQLTLAELAERDAATFTRLGIRP